MDTLEKIFDIVAKLGQYCAYFSISVCLVVQIIYLIKQRMRWRK